MFQNELSLFSQVLTANTALLLIAPFLAYGKVRPKIRNQKKQNVTLCHTIKKGVKSPVLIITKRTNDDRFFK